MRVGHVGAIELFNFTEQRVAEVHDDVRKVIRDFDSADRAWLNYLNDN